MSFIEYFFAYTHARAAADDEMKVESCRFQAFYMLKILWGMYAYTFHTNSSA